MMAALARAAMALAIDLVQPRRPEWAAAMAGEFEAAREDGRALRFAGGCLAAAARDLCGHASGRFAVARTAFALLAILPFAAFHTGCGIVAIRFLATGRDRYHAMLLAGDAQQRAFAPVYHDMTALLALPVLLLGAAHMGLAWNLIEWRPRRMLAMLGLAALSAATIALTILAMMPAPSGIALQFAAVAIECLALPVFLAWRIRHRPFPASQRIRRP
jgi:hypothetical protein